jgi:hypothetical protein
MRTFGRTDMAKLIEAFLQFYGSVHKFNPYFKRKQIVSITKSQCLRLQIEISAA